jgi:beta-glucosidase
MMRCFLPFNFLTSGTTKCRADFTEFADVCFREFGDRVSYWTTIDEPNVSALGSYDNALFAPGRCSDPFGITKCTVGDSTVEPYIAAHNMILAHASATRLYREKYRVSHLNTKLTISPFCEYITPFFEGSLV